MGHILCLTSHVCPRHITEMLLVMLQTYDLKGSERNRLVKAARKPGKEEVVLLDENFLHGERGIEL